MQPAESQRVAETTTAPLGRVRSPSAAPFGLLDIGEDTPGPFQVAARRRRSRSRTAWSAATAAQPRRSSSAATSRVTAGRRQLKLARRRREPLQVGDRDKGLHGVDPVHAIISYDAMMKCQSR